MKPRVFFRARDVFPGEFPIDEPMPLSPPSEPPAEVLALLESLSPDAEFVSKPYVR